MCRHIHIYHRVPPLHPGSEPNAEYDDEQDVTHCKVIFDKCETARWGEDCGGSTVEEVVIERELCQWCTIEIIGG